MNGGTHQTSEKVPLHVVVCAVNVCTELRQTTCVNGGWVTDSWSCLHWEVVKI